MPPKRFGRSFASHHLVATYWNSQSAFRSRVGSVCALCVFVFVIIIVASIMLGRATSREARHREVIPWREMRRECLREKTWPHILCWETAKLVWHVRQTEVWRVIAWDVKHDAVVPSSEVSFPMSQIPLQVLSNKSSDAQWTLENPPSPDGFIHILVDQFPCERHGCCAVHWQIRPNSTDLVSVHNHFVQFQYSSLLLLPIAPRFILDAGGNGMAALTFALLYPTAKIIRVEPHPGNFRAGVLNTFRHSNIVHVNLALWENPSRLQLCDEIFTPKEKDPTWPFGSARELGFWSRDSFDRPCRRVIADDIQGSTLSSIMHAYEVPHFDIVKLDVEGAERRLFSHSETLRILEKVQVLIAEVHERSFPGVSKMIFKAFKKFGSFRPFSDDKNVLFIKESLFTC